MNCTHARLHGALLSYVSKWRVLLQVLYSKMYKVKYIIFGEGLLIRPAHVRRPQKVS